MYEKVINNDCSNFRSFYCDIFSKSGFRYGSAQIGKRGYQESTKSIQDFPNDTVRFNHYELPFDFNRTLYDYLQKLKFHNTSYEVFVFDKQLTNVYVVHRIFLLHYKLGREYYLGDEEDRSLSSLLSTKKYDYVFNIHYNDLGFYKAILGFKDGLIEMSYYKDGLWHSELVCGSDDFSFLKPLLDDKIIK